MRVAVVAVLAVLALVLSAFASTAAAASTVSIEGDVLLVVAAPGETNVVSVSQIDPPGSEPPSEYTVVDESAGAMAGAGCGRAAGYSTSVSCPGAAVKSITIRLGDGDDRAFLDVFFPTAVYGEEGNDDISLSNAPGTLADGGEGNDNLQGGDDLRGGPGDDQLTGSRLVDGGDGNDVVRKTDGRAGGLLVGGPGDDSLDSGDGAADQLQCGAGRDVITSADDSDRNDGTCESGTGVARPPRPVKAQVTVFELPNGRTRPGRDGRLAVWMRCTVPNCSVTVRIVTVGTPGNDSEVYVRFRNPPLRRLTVGTTATLVHIPLTRAQRRGLSRNKAYTSVGAIVTTQRPGADYVIKTDGFYCRRASPCDPTPGRSR